MTGAAAEIGRAVADRFVVEGARVAYADRDAAGAAAAAAASGGQAVTAALRPWLPAARGGAAWRACRRRAAGRRHR
nr:hypothetical protein [Blastococcus litoris]